MIEELYAEMMHVLRLKTFPFGVKIYDTLDEKPLRVAHPRHPMNVCQITALARYYGRSAYFTAKDMACVIGAVSLGLIEPTEAMESGKIAAMLHADLESAKKFTDLVPRIPYGFAKAVAVDPLDKMTFHPDIVVAYGNSAQIMRVVQAYLWKRGGRVSFSTGGEYSLCADTIAQSFNSQDITIAVPCFGDRKTGLAQDDELTVAFPTRLTEEILEGLRGTSKTAAYPTPFDIGFPQMPDYTLTPWAVGWRAKRGR